MNSKINNIEIIQGDLTAMNLDIIVNAANHTLLGGGGIDGVIHYKAGPELLEECKKLNGCEIGSAKITDAYKLPCKKIIHACGPMYYGHKEEAPIKLKECYKKCLELAENYRLDNNLKTVSINSLPNKTQFIKTLPFVNENNINFSDFSLIENLSEIDILINLQNRFKEKKISVQKFNFGIEEEEYL